MEAQIRLLERQLASAEASENALQGPGAAASVRLAIARKDADLEAELSANAERALPSLPDDARQDLRVAARHEGEHRRRGRPADVAERGR